jgi:hypothetical protein
MRYKEFVTELRKNPEQNPKVTTNIEIYRELDKAEKNADTIAGVTNVFVSFTNVNKLGINPRSKYRTPIGIYAYSADYIKKQVGDGDMKKLPFAGNSRYATIFKAKGNIINLATISESEVNLYYKKLGLYWSKISGKDATSSIEEFNEIVNYAAEHARFNSYPGARLWHVTAEIATMMKKEKMNRVKEDYDPDAPVDPSYKKEWNSVFKNIGIDGCVDPGVSIIHPGEPDQALFFNLGSIVTITRIINKLNYNPHNIYAAAKKGNEIKSALTSKYDQFRSMSVAEQTAAVIKNPKDFKFMPNPPENLQIKLCELGYAHDIIKYIQRPSEAVQMAAVSYNPSAIRFILRKKIIPSEAVQLAAVSGNIKTDGYALQYILRANIKPSEKVLAVALNKYPNLVDIVMSMGFKISEPIQHMLLKKSIDINKIKVDPKYKNKSWYVGAI